MYRHRAACVVQLSTVLSALSGCTVVAHDAPTPDWPALDVVVHRIPHKDMRNACMQYTHWLNSPEACATVNFKDNRCDVYLSNEFPVASHEEHEYMHCKGFDHVGETTLRDAWLNYRKGEK